MVMKWIPSDGKKGRSLMARLKLVKEDGEDVPYYSVWSSDCPEPEDNPFKVKPETLRRLGYKLEDE